MLMKLTLAALLVISASSIARAEQTRREQQLFACQDDMDRLCPGDMSDSKKLKNCIRPKRAQVSMKCRAWLDVPEK